jgi:hypothetical protein
LHDVLIGKFLGHCADNFSFVFLQKSAHNG